MLGYNKTKKLAKCYYFRKNNFWSENMLFKNDQLIQISIFKNEKYIVLYLNN